MSDAQALFYELNRQYFNGTLPEYQIVLREDLRSGCGECDKKKREIHLKATDGDELTKVMLHEMAHAAVPRLGHGKSWRAEMQRLFEMGAPTREDWEAYQYPRRTINNKDIEDEAFDRGMSSSSSWSEARTALGVTYGLTNVHGRSVSKRATRLLRKLRGQFHKGRKCGWPTFSH